MNSYIKLLIPILFIPMIITNKGESKFRRYPIQNDHQRQIYFNDIERRDSQLGLSDDSFNKLPACNEDELVNYLAQMQVINPESIVYSASVDGIDELCLKVSDNVKQIDDFLLACEPPHEKDLYMQLIKGIKTLYEKLCKAGKFKTDFLEQWPCFHDLQREFVRCTGPEDWTEDMSDFKVCKAYNSIETCYYTETKNCCGPKAADLMKELTSAVLDSVLTVDCENVVEDEQENVQQKVESKSMGQTNVKEAAGPNENGPIGAAGSGAVGGATYKQTSTTPSHSNKVLLHPGSLVICFLCFVIM